MPQKMAGPCFHIQWQVLEVLTHNQLCLSSSNSWSRHALRYDSQKLHCRFPDEMFRQQSRSQYEQDSCHHLSPRPALATWILFCFFETFCIVGTDRLYRAMAYIVTHLASCRVVDGRTDRRTDTMCEYNDHLSGRGLAGQKLKSYSWDKSLDARVATDSVFVQNKCWLKVKFFCKNIDKIHIDAIKFRSWFTDNCRRKTGHTNCQCLSF